MTKEIPTSQPGVSIETDPAKNEAADKVIDLLSKQQDSRHTEVTIELLRAAGKALANRYHFVLASSEFSDELGFIKAYIEPSKPTDHVFWGPIDHLLPLGFERTTGGEWHKFMLVPIDEANPVQSSVFITPLDVAKSLQKAGFFWDKKEQELVDPTLTEELSALETKAQKSATAAPKKSKKSAPAPKR